MLGLNVLEQVPLETAGCRSLGERAAWLGECWVHPKAQARRSSLRTDRLDASRGSSRCQLATSFTGYEPLGC